LNDETASDFALTGATQIFNLYEAHGGYQSPAIVEKLSSVHQDQVFAFGDHHASGTVPRCLDRLRNLNGIDTNSRKALSVLLV
jgi:hypothetical protein